jgi:hypothetical protein
MPHIETLSDWTQWEEAGADWWLKHPLHRPKTYENRERYVCNAAVACDCGAFARPTH